ncbi:hypothetical protein [Saccharopolyspora cebuensis]|uniref:Uncharacterized protein n=1 Tax=Saccharopolyspora cebuensis TaxID=418759 RepID=A0ABV4CMA1_9PSEU
MTPADYTTWFSGDLPVDPPQLPDRSHWAEPTRDLLTQLVHHLEEM